jgi:hypothetical protein
MVLDFLEVDCLDNWHFQGEEKSFENFQNQKVTKDNGI